MTDDFIEKFMLQVDERFAALTKRVVELEATVKDQADEIIHLREQVRSLQHSNSALHTWNINHELEHDEERRHLKERVATLENFIRENGLAVPA